MKDKVSLEDEAALGEPAIKVRNLTLIYEHKNVFENLNFSLEKNQLHVITSNPDRGRTSLLLTIAGRMKHTKGKIEVEGITEPRKIQNIVSIAGFKTIDDIDPAVKVKDVLLERIRWIAPWEKFIWKLNNETLKKICNPVYGTRKLPDLDAYYGDLTDLDAILLKISLANYNNPKIIVLDDIEQVRSDSERVFLANRLATLAREKTIVTTSVNPLPVDSPAYIPCRVLEEPLTVSNTNNYPETI